MAKVSNIRSSGVLGQVAPTASSPIFGPFKFGSCKTLVISKDRQTLQRLFPSGQIEDSVYKKGLVAKVLLDCKEGKDPDTSTEEKVIEADHQLAREAIQNLRNGKIDAAAFAKAWTQSNFHRILHWLRVGTARTSETLPVAQSELVRILLEDALRKCQRYQVSGQMDVVNSAPNTYAEAHHAGNDTKDQRRLDLENACAQWSKNAHSELQTQLNPTELGPMWRSLVWWRLPFRADDVQANATTLVERSWLVESERKLLYLCGRFESLLAMKSSRTAIDRRISDVPPQWKENLADSKHEIDDALPQGTPNLVKKRQNLIRTSVGNLAAQAQTTIINAGSKTFFTGALATLVYISPPIASFSTLSEAAAIATLGLMYSAYGVQRRWEASRVEWLNNVHLSGVDAVRRIERFLRSKIQSLPNKESSGPSLVDSDNNSSSVSTADLDDDGEGDFSDDASVAPATPPTKDSVERTIAFIETAMKELERVRARTRPEDEEIWQNTDPEPLQSSGSQGDLSLNNSATPGPRISYGRSHLFDTSKRSRSRQPT